MRKVSLAIPIAAAAVVGFVASAAPAGVEAPSRIVDRTFVCSPKAFGGVGDLDVYVTPHIDYQNGFVVPAYLFVGTGGFNFDDKLVFVRARPQAPFRGSARGTAITAAGVYAHSRRCSPLRASVTLSSKGLAGPPVQWNKELDCTVRGRVLVRVRALLETPAEWRRADRPYEGVKRSVIEAAVAVRGQRTGRPIALMQLDKAGKTKLWFSSACG